MLNVPVVDPFGIAYDPEMPFLAQALNPVEVQRHLGRHLRHLRHLAGEPGQVRLEAIRVLRHKRGRRCLIAYDLAVDRSPGLPEAMTLIGKARARGLDTAGLDLLAALRNAGFAPDSPDEIAVPEPVGAIPEFQMWLQRKVPGTVATELLAGPDGVRLAERIAEAAHKLHQAGISPRRGHTMADELRILHDRLSLVAQSKPDWARRLERLLDACDRLGAATPEPIPRGIHRDFYPDQVLVDGSRLYLVDLDLYCAGDPALDIGNFLGHLTEQALRTRGYPDALRDQERALEERYVQLGGDAARIAVRIYTTLTLVRHIHLSTQFPERRRLTEPLLDVCEQRLGADASWLRRF